MSERRSVIVLGAGIVGVACALELQARGLCVTLVDRRAPGQETSHGNAGVLARSSLVPFNSPSLWAALPRLLRNRSVSLRYQPGYLLRQWRWGLRFLAQARPAAFEATATALDALIKLSMREHRRLLHEAGVADRLRDGGWLLLHRSEAAFTGTRRARQTFARFGIATEALDAAALHALEPALAPVFARALWVRDTLSVDDPGAVVQAYAALFVRRGGTLLEREAVAIRPANSGWCLTCRHADAHAADALVVALGAWSPPLLAPLGLAVPMALERGYHMHYGAPAGTPLGRPVHDAAGGYVLSPMGGRLRLTTGIELAAIDAPPSTAQLALAEAAARQAIALGPRLDATPWLGRRPTLPDSRPMIGAAPRHPGLWLAFGHQHIGFNTGPGTARLLGALMAGEAPEIDAAPFRPERFL